MKTRSLVILFSLVGGLATAVSTASAHCGSCGVGDKAAAHACEAGCEESCCAESGHALKGEVVSVDVAKRMVVVKHEAIADVMGAMTMGFAVPAEYDLATLKKGDKIDARLVKDGEAWLIKNIKKHGTT
jgi:Cu/Ag efflux protein CusF